MIGLLLDYPTFNGLKISDFYMGPTKKTEDHLFLDKWWTREGQDLTEFLTPHSSDSPSLCISLDLEVNKSGHKKLLKELGLLHLLAKNKEEVVSEWGTPQKEIHFKHNHITIVDYVLEDPAQFFLSLTFNQKGLVMVTISNDEELIEKCLNAK